MKGKIVLCDVETEGTGQLSAGAVGTVMQGRRPSSASFAFPLPAAYVSLEDGGNVYSYMNSTRYIYKAKTPLTIKDFTTHNTY